MDDLYITHVKSPHLTIAYPGGENTETFVLFGNANPETLSGGGWYVAMYWDRVGDRYQVWSADTPYEFYPTLKQAEDYVLGYLAGKGVILNEKIVSLQSAA